MTQFISIAKNTFVQNIRQPIFGVMVFLTFAILVISVPLTGWTMGSDYEATDQQLLENVGLSSLLLMGMLTAAFCASSAIGREIENKTALTVISKPVSRTVFVLGKFMGVATAVSLAFYLGTLVFLLTVRHGTLSSASQPDDWPVIVLGCIAFVVAILVAGMGNYVFGWSFMASGVISLAVLLTATMGAISVIGKGWEIIPFTQTFGPGSLHPQLLLGIVLIYMAVILMTAVAVAVSTRLGQIMTLLITLAVLVGGSAYQAIAGELAKALPGGQPLGWLLPCLSFFFPLDALARNQSLPVGWVFLYFASYLGGMLALAVGLFQTRQLAATSSSSSLPSAVAILSGLGRIVAIAAVVVAAVMFTRGQTYQQAQSLIVAGGLIIGGLATWFAWSGFGSGRRWAYWVVLIVAGLGLGRYAAVLSGFAWAEAIRMGASQVRILLGTIICSIVLVILILPKTRHHFKS